MLAANGSVRFLGVNVAGFAGRYGERINLGRCRLVPGDLFGREEPLIAGLDPVRLVYWSG